jgi:hypothetical protein
MPVDEERFLKAIRNDPSDEEAVWFEPASPPPVSLESPAVELFEDERP